MKYNWFYKTPDGFSDILLNSDGKYLTGLCFAGTRDACKYEENYEKKELPVFNETAEWLSLYFNGSVPDFTPKYKIEKLTPFRKEVIDIMLSIPYGKTVTYGEIARKIAENHGIEKMSAQAVGGAVGWNPLCLIVPCHRVVGADGSLTGYGGGINNKFALLKLEQHDMSKFTLPKRETLL